MKIVAQAGEPIEIQTDAGILVVRISSVTSGGRTVASSARVAPRASVAPVQESAFTAAAKPGRKKRATRTFSPEAKARLAAAARKRWAAAKRAGKSRL